MESPPVGLVPGKTHRFEYRGMGDRGRFDFMFGTDTPYTQARGDWGSRLIGETVFRFYKVAMLQAYIDILTLLGSG